MNILEVLSLVGAVLGPAGAVLVASTRASWRAAGFGVWVVSNVVLAAWAALSCAWALLGMWSFYLAIACAGLRNNLRDRPREVEEKK